jgi:glycosyltransferase involved in cell wall biosynthesis
LNNIKDKSRFTGVGNNICSELKKIGIDEQKVIYIPNGVNIERFKPSIQKKQLREKFGIPKDSMVLLSIGRLTEQKDPIKLIDTFYLINKKMKNTTLVISGCGEILNDVKKYVEKKKLKNILLLGYVDEKLKPDLYACADYFMTSSKYEGGEPPLTLSEAMSSGLPCIVSNIQNFELIRESKCGLVIEFSNIEKCIDEIIDYLESDNYNDSINARKFAKEKLSWCIIAEKYLEQYKKPNR